MILTRNHVVLESSNADKSSKSLSQGAKNKKEGDICRFTAFFQLATSECC